MSSLPIVLVGAGRMGAVHADVLLAHSHAELAAVVDLDIERAAAVAEAAGGAVASHDSLTRAVAHTRAQAVVIATSTPSHAVLVDEAIRLGVDILCEKPLTLDSKTSLQIGDAAAAAGVRLQIGFWRRYSPLWSEARRLIADGAIGAPVFIRLAQWDADPPPPEFCDPSVSGGLLVDCGIHEFDLTGWLTGSPTTAVLGKNLPVVDPGVGASGDVDNAVALVELESGATGVIDLSRNSRFGDDVRTEILGSRGALIIETLPQGRLILKNAQGSEMIASVDDAMWAGLTAQLDAFLAGASGFPDADASAQATGLAQAAQRSAVSGSTWIPTSG